MGVCVSVPNTTEAETATATEPQCWQYYKQIKLGNEIAGKVMKLYFDSSVCSLRHNLEISSLRKGLKRSPCGNEYQERYCISDAATKHKINPAKTTTNTNNKDRLI